MILSQGTPVQEENKKILGIFDLGDVIDRAIVNLVAGNRVEMSILQKGMFVYLYSYAVVKNLDPEKILKDASFEPSEQGPVSDMVTGQAETLAGDGVVKIDVRRRKYILNGSAESTEKYLLDSDEERLIRNVKNLIETLSTSELMFYIYFNPQMDRSLSERFIPSPKVRDSMIRNKEKYLVRLLRKGVIDGKTKDLILAWGSAYD